MDDIIETKVDLIETKNDEELVSAVKAQWAKEAEQLETRIETLEALLAGEKRRLTALKARLKK